MSGYLKDYLKKYQDSLPIYKGLFPEFKSSCSEKRNDRAHFPL